MTDPAAPRLPAEFDETIYREHERNPDLRGLSTEQARHHYLKYGRAEGRPCSAVTNRADFLALLPDPAAILEIGPGGRPAFPQATRQVRYLDVMTADALRQHVATPEYVPGIDFVWHGEPYRSLLGQRFDAVLAAGSLDRQPCLISHLTDVASVLNLGARYFLALRDRRYGAEYYLPDSGLADALDAFAARRTRHAAGALATQLLLLTHDDPMAHWNGDHGPDPRGADADPALHERIDTLLRTARASTGYADARAWRFTPDSFRRLIDALALYGLSPLRIERVYPTLRPSGEFYAVLHVAL